MSNHLDDEIGQILDSPDGDPAKRGTITDAVAIFRGDGLPPDPELNPTRQPSRLAVAARRTDLLVVPSLESALAGLYDSDAETSSAVADLRDTISDHQRRSR